jgi:O-antigen ligase
MTATTTQRAQRSSESSDPAGAGAEPRLLAGLSATEIGVLGVALLLPVVFAPALFSPFWAPKMALLVCVAGPGLVFLISDARRRDRASIAALTFVVIATISTAVSGDPVASLVGLHEVDGGLVFVIACIAMWELGRRLGERARALLPDVLLVGIGITSAVAWLQIIFHFSLDELGLFAGARAGALQGNPVYIGALAGAALVLVSARAQRAEPGAPFLLWLPAAALFSGAAQLSGSRIGLAAGLVVVALYAVRALVKRANWIPAAAVVVAAIVGVVLALAIAPSGGSATSRSDASEVGTNWQARVGIWGMGIDAFEHAPVFGVGPGRFRAETSRYMPLDIAQDHGADVLLVDAHNVVVEYLTTTGVLGLLAAATWLVFALRRARGPLLGFAAVIGVTWLLQPQGVDTTPMLMVALGASAPLLLADPARRPDSDRSWGVAAVAALLVGVVAAGAFLYGELELGRARDQGSQAALDRARSILGFFPVVDSLDTEIAIKAGLDGNVAARARAIALARATVRTEPTRPAWWNRLGEVEGQWGSKRAAAHAFHEALRYDPWSVRAMEGLRTLAQQDHDDATVQHWTARLCEFSEATCPAN